MSEEGSSSSWWGVSDAVTSNIGTGVSSFWTKAKETGSYVYGFTANDLNEVATALKQDVIVPSATSLKHKLQPHAQYGSLTDKVATMLGNVADYLAPEYQDVPYLSRYGDDRLAAIQTSQETYLDHVTDDHYTDWVTTFTLDEHTHEISKLLVDNVGLRSLHTKLVPGDLSYTNFWKVYYYRTELFNQAKQRHTELLERAGKEHSEEEELKWSDEEEEEEEGVSVEKAGEETPTESIPLSTEEANTPEETPTESIPLNTEEANTSECVIPEGSSSKSDTHTSPKSTEDTDTKAELENCSINSTDDQKAEVSSDGSFELVKHKDLESDTRQKDEDFEKALDSMIETINVDEEEDKWEDWE